jgi:hypothetical protein
MYLRIIYHSSIKASRTIKANFKLQTICMRIRLAPIPVMNIIEWIQEDDLCIE